MMWNPANYDGIKSIYISSELLWTPKFFHNDSHQSYGLGTCKPMSCLITHDAQVACLFPCHQKVHCQANLTDWPFDTQACTFVFTTGMARADATFEADTLIATMTSDTTNGWEMMQGKIAVNPNDSKHLKFSFFLRRISGLIFMHIYVPGYALIFLTLSVLWIRHCSFTRLFLSGVSIYLHFGLMDRVWWQ